VLDPTNEDKGAAPEGRPEEGGAEDAVAEDGGTGTDDNAAIMLRADMSPKSGIDFATAFAMP
jgi:hypothetical protein